MATLFLDGPAMNVSLNLARAPVFLRVVQDQKTQKWDALDQIADQPKDDEAISMYVLDGDVSYGIACSRDKNGSHCRRFWMAEYRYYSQQPTQEELRDYDFWAEWTQEQWGKLRDKPKGIA